MADENSIAIVGMAGHFPGARSVREYWSMLEAGRDATRWLTPEELVAAGESFSAIQDPRYIRATMALPDMEMFDAGFFGFSPREAAILDPQHRHFLECCWEALEDAGHMPADEFEGAVGVFGGCGMQAYLAFNLLSNPELVESEGMFLLRHTGNDKDFLTTRVSYLLNLHGPSIGIQTACSTSLVAIHMAVQSLLARECDMALAGGASIDLPHGRGYRHAEGEILSSTGRCRAFDDAADGTLFGSGAAVVALRRLDDALRDGDNIHAVILGSAINNDGARKAGYLAPSIDGQAMAAAEALAIAGVDPASVDYIEAHGTGTLVGDPIELSALQQVYGEAPAGSIGIGSVKTNIGHLDTAAGIASLIKVVMAMRGEKLPATLNFSKPNSRFDFARSPFKVVGEQKDWPRTGRPRRASVNSLGVGGTNAHVVIEEPPILPPAMASGPQIIALSAKTKTSLEGLVAKWRDFATDPGPGFCIANSAFTTQTGRKHFAHRATVVASDAAELADQLSPNGTWRRTAATAKDVKPRIVFMFPGGGAQYPNAARSLYENNPVFRNAVEACFKVLEAGLATDLRRLMFDAANFQEGSAALERPTYSLLAVFIVEYALSKLWESWGVVPDAVIGHSAGEYAAAVLAGIMSLEDAIGVVLERGEIFENAPAGGMVSVQDEEARVRALVGDDLDIAVLNSPQVTVVSGALEPLAAFSKRLEAEGIKHAPVRIKVAAHSRMLDSGLARFRARLDRVKLTAPKIEFINNLVGAAANPQELATSDYWVSHLRGAVRFADGLSAVLAKPDTILLEVGPGQALCALAGLAQAEHAPRGVVASLPTAVEHHDAASYALSAFGHLWALGAPVDFSRIRTGEGLRRVSVPSYAFERQRHWIEPGKGKAAAETDMPQIFRSADVKDWFETRVFEPAPLSAAPQAARAHVVFSDGSELASEVINRLRARGDTCFVVSHDAAAETVQSGDGAYSFNAAAADYAPLIDALSKDCGEPDTLVFLWPALFARTEKTNGPFDAAFTLTKGLQLSGWAEKALFLAVTQNAFAAQNGETCDIPQAGVLGPWRMLSAEQPGVRSRLVDFDAKDDATGRALGIVSELDALGDAPVIAWRNGQRLAPVLKREPTDAQASVLRDRGVYLITGGLGGIGLELARYLAGSVKARLVLTGRTPAPPRENWERLAAGWGASAEVARARELIALEEMGAEVLVLAADVAKKAAMEAVVAEATARFGAINGVFHAAGMIDDAPMAMKSLEEAHRVLAAKADGARVLDALLPDGSLDLFTVFSSTSVLITPPGQSDYVAGNAIAEAVAMSRRDGRVITWGVWSDIGMAKRAADAGAVGTGGVMHPLLGARQETKNGTLQFAETFSEASLWALAEHRIGDIAVLPGSAYVEIASAAALSAGLGDAIEISQLSYVAPLAIHPRQSRQVRTTLTPLEDDGFRIEVESRAHAGEVWLLHFEARLSARSLGAEPVASVPCPAMLGAERLTLTERGVAFGPRWNNVIRAAMGDGAVSAQFALPGEFAADLGTYRIHPALFDTSFAAGLFLLENDAERGVFAPVSIDAVRVHGALTGAFTAESRLISRSEDAASFDVDIQDASGAPLLEIRGASFRLVSFSGDIPAVPDMSATVRDRLLAEGIRASEARGMFEHLFAQGAQAFVVSPVSVSQALLVTNGPATATQGPSGASADRQAVIGRDPVEQRLAQMCSEILGVEALGLDEEFLSYGGGSLTGVRLFARIRREMGVELALSALLQAPTIRTLAVLVREGLPEPLEETPAASETSVAVAETTRPATVPQKPAIRSVPAKSRWTPIVRMVQGKSGVKPVFLVHGAGGTALVFKPLADSLKNGSTIYGIEAQGVDGTLPVHETIEEMAELYVRHVLTVDPAGPYRFIGYSGGGVIAVEMAHRLRQSGRQVEFLCMLDTLAPQEMYRPVQLNHELKRLSRKVRGWMELGPGEIRARFAKRARKVVGTIKPPVEPKGQSQPRSHIEVFSRNCIDAYKRAQERYHPPEYPGDVLLFRAKNAELPFERAGDRLGWDGIITGAMEVIVMNADHYNILRIPNIDNVAKEISRRLKALDSARSKAEEVA
ncbi:type I polyketide synthase [Hyphomonas sp.]|uniref:type I polyketide synthase n=1 Tax=Hyphomonas sp. TaxID=87 RepID=UPI001BCBDF44|nr:type I polyketide synthase [Hyphomonas sp.]